MLTTRTDLDSYIKVISEHERGFKVTAIIYKRHESVERKVIVNRDDRLVIEIIQWHVGTFGFSARNSVRRVSRGDKGEYASHWQGDEAIPGQVMAEVFLRLYEWNGE